MRCIQPLILKIKYFTHQSESYFSFWMRICLDKVMSKLSKTKLGKIIYNNYKRWLFKSGHENINKYRFSNYIFVALMKSTENKKVPLIVYVIIIVISSQYYFSIPVYKKYSCIYLIWLANFSELPFIIIIILTLFFIHWNKIIWHINILISCILHVKLFLDVFTYLNDAYMLYCTHTQLAHIHKNNNNKEIRNMQTNLHAWIHALEKNAWITYQYACMYNDNNINCY